MGVGTDDVVERSSTFDTWVARRRFVTRIHALLDAQELESACEGFMHTHFGEQPDVQVSHRYVLFFVVPVLHESKSVQGICVPASDGVDVHQGVSPVAACAAAKPASGSADFLAHLERWYVLALVLAVFVDLLYRSSPRVREYSCAVSRFFWYLDWATCPDRPGLSMSSPCRQGSPERQSQHCRSFFALDC
jgi:hypothetical protein